MFLEPNVETLANIMMDNFYTKGLRAAVESCPTVRTLQAAFRALYNSGAAKESGAVTPRDVP